MPVYGGGMSTAAMSTREQVREFLTGRRARLSLADVGLPDYLGGHRGPREARPDQRRAGH
ncbi:hypothetical protein GCM10025862_15450 [Arsenicicoccus piscis]|uniref:Uncharacterized protein n=2 Tax=Arsenicicoccus piscis TaxID=673954 RepID=A0ABQ6HM55_9MICO|nr:hypothetical protein GCM10025862_15450 [Arsenicicoccus piscis]